MAIGRAVITKVVTGGPYTYTWFVVANDVPQGNKAEVGLSAAACFDAIKTLAASLPGTILNIQVNVNTDG